MENIANNIANANTAGFKSRRAQFQDLLYQNLIQPGAAATQQTTVPTGLQLGLGTRAVFERMIFTQGDFSETDNPLDVVIQGTAFFRFVSHPVELAYTKAGTFHLNRQRPDGRSRTATYSIRRLPFRKSLSLTIGSDGTVSYTLPGQSRGAASRPDPARQLRQSFRPQQHRQQPVPADRRFRRPA